MASASPGRVVDVQKTPPCPHPQGAPPQQSRNPTGLEKVGAFSISLLLGHFNNSDPISGPFMEKALSTFGVSAASH